MQKYMGNQAEELMQRAQDLDIDEEVERRFEEKRRLIEESRNLNSARSVSSYDRTNRTEKRVQFAKSVHSASTKPTTVSTERVKVTHTNLRDDDDISESIQMAESITQSLRSQSAAEISKSRSENKLKSERATQKKLSVPQNDLLTAAKDKGSDSESAIPSEYSQDFTESNSSRDLSGMQSSSKAKLQAKAKDLEESAAYSEAFEEESMSKSLV